MKKRITHGSTFSGIGAPEVAAEMLGWENVFHCEINPFGRQVLDYYYPDAESYEDITKTDFTKWRGKVTVLTGGFPCQPFSYAGKRRGSEDDRYLWPFMLRCIQQVRPTWFVGENVAGISTMVFPGEDVAMGADGTLFDEGEHYRREERYVIEEICQSLEREGYSVQPMLIPACAVGAPHRRDRIFFIAHRNEDLAEDPLRGGLMVGEQDQQGSERNVGDTGAGNDERTHREEMAGAAADANSSDDAAGEPGIASEAMPGEGIQERDAVQQPVVADSLRSSMGRTPSDSEDMQCNGSEPGDGKDDKSRGSEPGDCHSPEISNRVTSHPVSRRRREIHEQVQPELADGAEPVGTGRKRDATDPEREGLEGKDQSRGGEGEERMQVRRNPAGYDRQDYEGMLSENRWRTFPTVSPVYRGNDGFPFPVGNLAIPFNKWKTESLKAYGNAIVPQVMYEIFRAIEEIENS